MENLQPQGISEVSGSAAIWSYAAGEILLPGAGSHKPLHRITTRTSRLDDCGSGSYLTRNSVVDFSHVAPARVWWLQWGPVSEGAAPLGSAAGDAAPAASPLPVSRRDPADLPALEHAP